MNFFMEVGVLEFKEGQMEKRAKNAQLSRAFREISIANLPLNGKNIPCFNILTQNISSSLKIEAET